MEMGVVNGGVYEIVFEFTNNFLLKFSIPVKSPQNIEIIQSSTKNDIIYMNFNVNCLFQGLPLVVMFVQEEGMDKKELARLQEEGQNLADKWVFSVFFYQPRWKFCYWCDQYANLSESCQNR